jgi:hypothetical protein
MGNYIADNRDVLSQHHYIRKASAKDYWFDFFSSRVEFYQQKFGQQFCMVVYGSASEDDAYILPYTEVSTLFTKDMLDDRGRWIGYIKNNIIHLSPGNKCMSISGYYNTFDLLYGLETKSHNVIAESEVLYNTGDEIDKESLRERIKLFNQQYQTAVPHKRYIISEQVARPGSITDYLKKLYNYTCQICGEQGFVQVNGTHYIEAHHITELHKLIPGSYCSDNIIIVCANCHRKLHYSTVSYSLINSGKNIMATINGESFPFSRHLLSSEA